MLSWNLMCAPQPSTMQRWSGQSVTVFSRRPVTDPACHGPGSATGFTRVLAVGDQGTNALAALILGSAVAVLLFIPVAAVQYRRDGRLGPGDLTVLGGAAVYGVALWTYTLLPLPDIGDYACQHAQTRLMAFADDIRRAAEQAGYAGLGTPSELLRNRAFLQVVLNVVLFLPFGPFVRLITHRGVVVATGLGFAVSLMIEVTQLTGVWGVYPCAYRLFDVDDLLTNTLGALLGAVLSYPYAARRRRRLGTASRRLPTTVSTGRRLAATISDVLFVVLAGTAAAAVWRGYLVFAEHERPATDSASMIALRAGVPLLVQGLMVLVAGKTIGELVVDVRTTPPSMPRRLVKLLVGVVPLVLLAVVTVPAAQVALALLAVAGVVGAFVTSGHRGVGNALAGLRLEIDDG